MPNITVNTEKLSAKFLTAGCDELKKPEINYLLNLTEGVEINLNELLNPDDE